MFLPEGVRITSMKKEEARLAIVSEYDIWAEKHPDEAIMMGGYLFFRYLHDERSDLLDFRFRERAMVGNPSLGLFSQKQPRASHTEKGQLVLYIRGIRGYLRAMSRM